MTLAVYSINRTEGNELNSAYLLSFHLFMNLVISSFRLNVVACLVVRARLLVLEKTRSQPSKSSRPVPLTYKGCQSSWHFLA